MEAYGGVAEKNEHAHEPGGNLGLLFSLLERTFGRGLGIPSPSIQRLLQFLSHGFPLGPSWPCRHLRFTCECHLSWGRGNLQSANFSVLHEGQTARPGKAKQGRAK